MLVKIGDTIFNAENEPIMIVLNREEREQIANMAPDSKGKYCQIPNDSMSHDEVVVFMKLPSDEDKKIEYFKL